MTLTVGSLFSGIGGLDLGLERAGMRVIWQAETDPYASRVLAKHWPDVPNLGDVTKVDWDGVERPDLVCGGFPCQPVSVAGRRKAQDDERWLWPEVARCVRHLRPDWVLLENVPGLLVRGMGDVLGDLASLGYDCEWEGIPAAAVGAPHLRWRIFIVAYAQGVGTPQQSEGADARAVVSAGARAGRGAEHGNPAAGVRDLGRASASGSPNGWDVADADGTGPQGHGRPVTRARERPVAAGGVLGDTDNVGRARVFWPGRWREPTDTGWWATEPDVGRVAHGIPHRVDRLRCLGNAVVPQVAEYVGRRLLAAHGWL